MGRYIKKIKFVEIQSHVWKHLGMAWEHLDIIRINNKNSENQRFYSLENILITLTATLPKLW